MIRLGRSLLCPQVPERASPHAVQGHRENTRWSGGRRQKQTEGLSRAFIGVSRETQDKTEETV